MNYKEFKLENGLRVVSVYKETKFASIRIGVNVGALDENDEQAGISHFVEHLVFQGTQKRTNEELLRDLSLYCGDYNGYTSRNKTVYMFDTLTEDVEQTLDISSDMLMNSKFDENDIERERNIILSEIKIALDDVKIYGHDTAMKLAFPDDDISKTEDGSLSSVRKITSNEIREYYKTYYVPENTCIVIVSEYNQEYIKEIIEKYFGKWKNSCLPRKKRDMSMNMIAGEHHYILSERQQENLHYMYCVKDLSEVDMIRLNLLCRRLGFGMSSLLWGKLRSELGVTYDTYSDLTRYGNNAILECFAIVAPEDIDIAKKGIEEAISELFNKSSYEEGLAITKKEALFDSLGQIEYPERLSEFIISRMLEEKPFDIIEEYIDTIKNTTSEDLIEIANKVLNTPCIIHSLGK